MKRPLTRPAWYLRVGPRIHQKWDKKKRIAIITLREANTSPAHIAKVFGTTTTIIHNQTRIGRCSMKGVCFRCRKPLKRRKPGKPELCLECQKEVQRYKKRLREEAKKNKLCIACGKKKIKRKALKGHQYCLKCISATYRRRIKKGICGNCGERSISKGSNSLCLKCLRKNKKYSRKYRKIHHGKY